MSAHSVNIELGPPVIVAVSPPDVPVWGPYQFPSLVRLADGRIEVSYHVSADSVASYGLPRARAVSADDGQTWQPCPRTEDDSGGDSRAGVLLPNGDRLKGRVLRPVPVSALRLPDKPFAQIALNHKETRSVYRLEDLPPECDAGWALRRFASGGSEWQDERSTVRCSGETRLVADELGLICFPWHFQILVAPDGALWSVNRGLYRVINGTVCEKAAITVFRSTDQGHCWDMWSEIPYTPDLANDPECGKRAGFSEPEVCFVPDGAALMLMRTTNPPVGAGPLYWSKSADNGRIWSRPAIFDDLGVRPRLIALKNGVTLASYGRPGLYVRATSDPAGLRWDPRVTVIEPARKLGDETCSYTSLLAMNDHTALMAYTEFDLHRADGQRLKYIKVREISAQPVCRS